jgi:hypothetical protein
LEPLVADTDDAVRTPIGHCKRNISGNIVDFPGREAPPEGYSPLRLRNVSEIAAS